MKNEWQPIESCPWHKDVMFYRDDAGFFGGQYTYLESLMEDREVEESTLSEEDLFQMDYWAFCQDGVHRCDGDLKPTHWMIPDPPEDGRRTVPVLPATLTEPHELDSQV